MGGEQFVVIWKGQGKQWESFPVCLVPKMEAVHQYLRVAHLLSYHTSCESLGNAVWSEQ